MNSVPALVIERIFPAPIERVFDAWTNPDLISQWFGPPGFTVKEVSMDLRTNGKYRIVLSQPDGLDIEHFGEYISVVRPNELIFTWELINQDCPGSEDECSSTLVSLEFVESENSTQLRLTHEKLPTPKAYQGHQFGWTASLDALNLMLSR